ncbi:class I SAM-dependent methyltransferase [Myxococcota bacterium]|nr:class I SAM-dependent methyltransferase [Myxococcota bacterium]
MAKLLESIGTRVRRLLGKPRQIGEEEFKAWRRELFDPVTRSGACYVPMPGYESTVHYKDKQNLHHLGRYEWAVRVLGKLPSREQVLDCACGVGYGSRKLAEVFQRVDAVDVFDEAIAMARERYDHPAIAWRTLDASRLRDVYKENTFDAIVSFQTIESIADDGKFLDDLRFLLKPGGVLLIDTPLRKARVDHPENRHHKRYYSLDDWLDLLKRRFDIVTFGELPEAEFLRERQMPSHGSIVHCARPTGEW